MNEQQVGKASHIATLIIRRMQYKLTDEERSELETWLQEDGENYLLYEELMDEEKLGAALDELHTIDHHVAYEQLSQKLSLAQPSPPPGATKIWLYMAAALLILIAGGMLYVFTNSTGPPPNMPDPQVMARQKLPGAGTDSEKAFLILSDDTRIELNAVNNGSIAQQGNSTIRKNKNGELTYSFTGNAEYASIPHNILQTPRGGEYLVVLDDGTRIWLNAASSLRFPVHFNKDDRRVELHGEAYFEVASAISPATGHKKAFIVHVNNIDVQAVGTAFNIRAYTEDKQTQTTVVEGLVKVNTSNKAQLLPPGKKLISTDSSFTIEEADIKQETAWKSGQFVFRNTSIEDVMNELARWYDVDIEYERAMPNLHFSGQVEREATIDKVLEMLSLTGGVQFRRKGRTVKVLHASSFH